MPDWRGLIVGVIASLVSSSSWPVAPDNYPFKVSAVKEGNRHRVLALNSGSVPVTASVRLISKRNLASNVTWPMVLTVPPGQSKSIGYLFPEDAGERFGFRLRTSWLFGDQHAAHAPGAPYRLPFRDGEAYLISQASDGPLTTHRNDTDRHAVDFTMPAGTLVIAAREGVVVHVEGRYTVGGADPALLGKSNEVIVLHADRTLAHYSHLRSGTQLVSIGQKVSAGDKLGFSGDTGFASGAHLHFAVTKVAVTAKGELSEESLPVVFKTGNPAVTFTPKTGTTVRALPFY